MMMDAFLLRVFFVALRVIYMDGINVSVLFSGIGVFALL